MKSTRNHLFDSAWCCLLPFAVLAFVGGGDLLAAEKPFAWQQDYARVTETGDIQWTPRAFRLVAAGNVRFIDYEQGSDANAGDTKERPWKHHPWDASATGKAAAARGVDTYVFKVLRECSGSF